MLDHSKGSIKIYFTFMIGDLMNKWLFDDLLNNYYI